MAKKKSVQTKRRDQDAADLDSASTAGAGEERPSAVDFEASLAEIEKIVMQLEGGDLGLAESLEQYGRAIHRLKECHQLLQHAEQRISLLSGFDAEGNPLTEPLEHGETGSLEAKQQARGRRRGAKPGKRLSRGQIGDADAAEQAGQADSRDPSVSRSDADHEASVDDSPGLF